MKILTTASQVNLEITRLISQCDQCEAAVAWASIGFPVFDLLSQNSTKIRRLIIGTHFFQTHPKFIEQFRTHPNVRFVLDTGGVFHPKVYLFHMPGGKWESVIGSSNFTKGGMDLNAEVAVLISSEDSGAPLAFEALEVRLEAYSDEAKQISETLLSEYWESWKERRPILKRLGGAFGNLEDENTGDGGKTPSEIGLLRLSWPDYFKLVKDEEDRGVFAKVTPKRLEVIREIQKLFSSADSFEEIDLLGRRRIAGSVKPVAEGPNFLWFGSSGSGYFKQAIKNNSPVLSRALDQIPNTGPVSREDYMAFVVDFREALPQRNLIASGTRLLAMKRPDYFLCLNSRNGAYLCKLFKISKDVSFESYWDSIIERILSAKWWNVASPVAGEELEVWKARTAFLDAISYDGKDMPAPVPSP
jgi:HKD family nuclease